MPQILLVKTSSLGDVVHNLPVVSDIVHCMPGAGIDWVVEDSLQALPALHPGVRSVIPASMRRWLRSLWRPAVRRELREFVQRLREKRYDAVLDTQGLLKSALIARLAHGRRYGLDFTSAREPLAPFYDRTFSVPWSLHAVERNRSLAAQALGYRALDGFDYGVRAQPLQAGWLPHGRYAVLLHGSSAARKLWPEDDWARLGAHLAEMNLACVLPWGNAQERERSDRLAPRMRDARVAPRLSLAECARVLAGSAAVVGVDTGLTHLAAALGVPVVGVYCATDPAATGVNAGARAVNVGAAGKAPNVTEVIAALARVCAA